MRTIVSLSLIFLTLLIFASCSRNIMDRDSEDYEIIDPHSYISGSLKRGETFAHALQSRGLQSSDIYPILNELNSVYNLRRAQPSDSFVVKIDTLDVIQELIYYPYYDKINTYVVFRDTTDNYTAIIETLKVEKVIRRIEGVIESSLYESIRNLGIGPKIVVDYANIFQWDIDFFIDTRQGDEFVILFEQYMNNDEFVRYGNILAAVYSSRNYKNTAYRYTDSNAESRYYNEKGESFQKAFLRSPLNYTRITSYFSTGRYHPILKITRPHYGIDYAAPHGAPVVAVADGTVIHRGWKGGHPTVNGMSGGYGETVMIRHANGYQTLYGHLSRYGDGIRRGVRVTQNQVIGYVGQTGLATGPHLHYEVHHHNKPIDPLSLRNVAGPPVPESEMSSFREVLHELKQLMSDDDIIVSN